MNDAREMTLLEWCGKLPKTHRVNEELRNLLANQAVPDSNVNNETPQKLQQKDTADKNCDCDMVGRIVYPGRYCSWCGGRKSS